ncbi:MAG: 4-alpha-glucanotransferase [Pseudomonadota bacterium]
MTEPLIALAARHGVLDHWYDIAGTRHDTTPETALALMRAMGVIGDAAEAPERLAAADAGEGTRTLPHAVVTTAEEPGRLPLAPDAAWRVVGEDGAALAEGRGPDLPALAMGLHRLETAGTGALLVAAPPRAPTVEALAGRARIWGATGALHGLWQGAQATRGARGRYDDLGAAATALGSAGAAFLGINPVHALGTAHGGYSPYSPSHRGFLDTRAIPVEGLAPAPGALIDHHADRAAHDAALRARFAAADAAEHAALAAFRARHGTALEAFALFEALSLVHGPDWTGWPAGLEHPDAPGARAFAAAEPDEIAFHAWAQMAADRALGAAQRAAKAAGMALGLYTDLAVGVRPDGAEVWARPGVFARGVSLGAPPDMFSPDGQAWGLAPFSPPGLRADGYAAFVETIRAAVAHAGLLRIDHVLGLVRGFWVPDDGTPGGYVRADTEVLMAILQLEATRAGAVIVGEDLGVVPEGLREDMAERALYGCSVAMYEKWEGRIRAPWHHRAATLASFGTHDTPTLAGWWAESDIDWRERLGHTPPEACADMRAERAWDRRVLCWLMAEAAVLPGGIDADAPPAAIDTALIEAVHALVARSAAAMVAVQVDDALGTVEQANIPGTTDEHPNWRRRHAVAAGALGTHPAIRRIAGIMRANDRA